MLMIITILIIFLFILVPGKCRVTYVNNDIYQSCGIIGLGCGTDLETEGTRTKICCCDGDNCNDQSFMDSCKSSSYAIRALSPIALILLFAVIKTILL